MRMKRRKIEEKKIQEKQFIYGMIRKELSGMDVHMGRRNGNDRDHAV